MSDLGMDAASEESMLCTLRWHGLVPLCPNYQVTMTKKIPKSKLCPLCGDLLDLYCTGNKSEPFVDGKCYPKLCFVCFHVPRTQKQTYNEDGSVNEDIVLPYTHKSLNTAKELVHDGIADNLSQARKSVRAVRMAIGAADMKALKTSKKHPKRDNEIDPDLV